MALQALARIRHFQRDSTANLDDLPSEALQIIPTCGQACTLGYVKQDWAFCDSTSFSCLCSTTSSEGFTFGEVAYACSYNSCSDKAKDITKTLYDICQSQPFPAPRTRTAIILPALSTATATSSLQSSTTSSSSSRLTTSATSISRSAAPVTQPSSSSTVSVAAPTSTANATELTTAQAIGISVGTMGALIAIVGCIMLFLCLRKRRLHKMSPAARDSYDFVDEGQSKFVPAMIDRMRNGQLHQWQSPKTRETQKSLPAWPARTASRAAGGLQRLSRSLHDAAIQPSKSRRSRKSSESTRTVSQLLPDKPEPSPMKQKEPVVVPESPTTVIDDDPMSPRLTSTQLQPIQPPPKVYRIVNGTSGLPPASRLADKNSPPSLTLQIPRTETRGPSEAQASVGLPRNPRDMKANIHGMDDNIPEYYTSHSCHPYMPHAFTPADRKRRKVAPAQIRITHPAAPPQAVRASGGSDTSFESNDDEPTPPEEVADPTASPSTVQYPKIPRPSNQAVSRAVQPQPTSNLQTAKHLPATPPQRPEVQVYATPNTHYPSPSSLGGTGIAAKRRGDQVQHELESGLRLPNSARTSTKGPSPSAAAKVAQSSASKRYYQKVNEPTESPLRGYGRGVATTEQRGTPPRKLEPSASPKTPNIRSQDIILGSPMLWEPKITPSRRGDDLYLSVSLATPSTTPKEQPWHTRR